MKKIRIIFSVLLCALFLMPGTTAFAATNKYDAAAAVAYGKANVSYDRLKCDQFVKACLKAGGITIDAGDVDPVKDALLAGGYGTQRSLKLDDSGRFILKEDNPDVKPGDIMLCYCKTCGDNNHIVIVAGFNDEGKMYCYGNNVAWDEDDLAFGIMNHRGNDGETICGKWDSFSYISMDTSVKSHWHNFKLKDSAGVDLHESEHPHRMYAECACGVKYYLGKGDSFTFTISACFKCNPPVSTKPVIQKAVVVEKDGVKKVELEWSTVENGVRYKVYRAKSQGGPWFCINENTNQYIANYTNTSIQEPTYFYKIVAVKEGGEEVESDIKIVNISGEEMSVKPEVTRCEVVVENGKKRVKLEWNAAKDALKYKILRGISKTGTFTELSIVTGLSYTNSTVEEREYYYKVVAVQANGTETASDLVYANVSGETMYDKPVITKCENIVYGETKCVQLEWKHAKEAVEYKILRAVTKNGTYSELTTVTGDAFTNLRIEQREYYYKVVAVKENGTETESDPVYINTSGKELPAKPTITKYKLVEIDGKKRVQLEWTYSKDTEEYEIWRVKNDNTTYFKIITRKVNNYDNVNLEDNTKYRYKIKAIKADGTTVESDVVSVTVGEVATPTPKPTATPKPTVAPTPVPTAKPTATPKPTVKPTPAPEKLPAPSAKIANVASTGKPKISWNAVSGATKYEVWVSTSKNGTYRKLSTTEKTVITHTGAVAGGSYYYKIKAIHTNTNLNSVFSNVVSKVCDLPAPSAKIAGVASTGKLKISWNAVSGATKYEVYMATSKTGEYKYLGKTSNTSITHTGAKAGGSYYYKVKAIHSNANANSAFSSVVSKVCDLPAPSAKIATVLSSGKLQVSWNAVSGATKYEVWVSTSKNGTYRKLSTTEKTVITHTGAVAGGSYYYKVKAIHSNANANSAFGNVVSRVCDLARPELTVSLSSKGKPVLKWKAVPNAAKYEVYRATSKNGKYKHISTTTKTTVTHTGATAGTTYYYKVRAIHTNTNANSAYSTVKNIKSR